MKGRPPRPWYRFYVETIDDDKVMRHGLSALGFWAVLMSLARKSPLSGYLMISEATPHTHKTIAGKARVSEAVARKWMGEFERDGMIEHDANVGAWRLPKWQERQYESDNSAERTSRWRHKERDCDVTTTLHVTPPESEAETEAYKTLPSPSLYSRGAVSNPSRGRRNLGVTA